MADSIEELRTSELFNAAVEMLERLHIKGKLSAPMLNKARNAALSEHERLQLVNIVEHEIAGPGWDEYLDEPNAYGQHLEVLANWLTL